MLKNILVISPYNPFGPFLGGSSRSIRTRIERLSRDANVTLLTFYDEHQDGKTIKALGIESVFVPYTRKLNLLGKGFLRLVATLTGKLMFFTHINDMVNALAPSLKELLKKRAFDIVQFDDIIMTPLARHLPAGTIKFVFFHNVLTTYFTRLRDSKKNGRYRIAATIELYWIRRFEKAMLRFCNAAAVITDEEYRQVRSLSKSVVLYKIPLEVDTAAIVPRKDPLDYPSVAFCGTMTYPPNEEAVIYFASAILPLIRIKFPEIKLYIVGRNPGVAVQQLSSESIIVTGEVEDVQDYLSRANVIVAPILTGAGMRIKILEAFAMGKAVVSSTLGAEGIACSEPENIMFADEPGLFAEKVCFLLENSAKADLLGSNARSLVEREYDANLVWKKWQTIYRNIITASSNPSPG